MYTTPQCLLATSVLPVTVGFGEFHMCAAQCIVPFACREDVELVCRNGYTCITTVQHDKQALLLVGHTDSDFNVQCLCFLLISKLRWGENPASGWPVMTWSICNERKLLN